MLKKAGRWFRGPAFFMARLELERWQKLK